MAAIRRIPGGDHEKGDAVHHARSAGAGKCPGPYFGYNAGYSPELPRPQKGHADLTDAEAVNCVMFAVPPGLVSGCGGDYSSFLCVQPETVDRVRVKMGLIFYGEDWPEEGIERAVTLFKDTMAEDKVML